jgi:lipoyl synthase
VLADVRAAGVDVVTIGQYLRPSSCHLAVVEYVHPDQFAEYAAWGEALGLQMHSAPFVRSSFHAGESLEQAKHRGERELH